MVYDLIAERIYRTPSVLTKLFERLFFIVKKTIIITKHTTKRYD